MGEGRKLTDAEWQEVLAAALEKSGETRCVCCGAVIPEGRMVCAECESSTDGKLARKAAEVADALRKCRENYSFEGCEGCPYRVESASDAPTPEEICSCTDALMLDAELLLRAIFTGGR